MGPSTRFHFRAYLLPVVVVVVMVTTSWLCGEGLARAGTKRRVASGHSEKVAVRPRRHAHNRRRIRSPRGRRRAVRRKRGNATSCSRRGGPCRRASVFQGRGVATATLRTEPLPAASGDIEFIPIHFAGEVVDVNIFAEPRRAIGGAPNYDEVALAAVDRGFRCRRTGHIRAVNPRLLEIMSRIYEHFGRKPIRLVSGHRMQENESSRHFHGSAMDIRIRGVSVRRLYDYARSLDAGGMGVGIYPHEKFVHVDLRAPGAPSYRWTDWSRPKSSRKATYAHRRGRKSARTRSYRRRRGRRRVLTRRR